MNHVWYFSLGAVFGAVVSAPMAAYSFPIASPGTEGIKVLVSNTSPVIATYEGNSASFSNSLYLMLDGLGNPGDDGDFSNDLFIFNNLSSTVGSTVSLGSFSIGAELIFRLFVQNTGNNFFTGPASRNPDNKTHARVQENWMPNKTLVSFEDLFNGPFNYNDLSFSFTNTNTGTMLVPEPTSTLSLLVLGTLGAASTLKRQFKSSKSTEKETTKVS
ncbi:MAG: PEP-CTERM sorting domain-containing protein [Microcystis sp. LE19-12.2C]|uniref:PEP-CTERM sorting domain-containing protein n=1 Tax=Microcystis aeruginosa Ma_OC_H_19870700_S124 TaxID=2486262 RepID=A0A552ADF1_MICAE|nr:PEP-CTERM sorting domain-containing protein [Microcystis sp. LE19-12.2C]TRT83473.1 MAG: PEP-CTERM sorting domain-containing protein [Microcystis aeruginosa Ma_OC_H_19870700_S124]